MNLERPSRRGLVRREDAVSSVRIICWTPHACKKKFDAFGDRAPSRARAGRHGEFVDAGVIADERGCALRAARLADRVRSFMHFHGRWTTDVPRAREYLRAIPLAHTRLNSAARNLLPSASFEIVSAKWTSGCKSALIEGRGSRTVTLASQNAQFREWPALACSRIPQLMV
jgi:hypothetical protein